MIEVYKIINQKYDCAVAPKLIFHLILLQEEIIIDYLNKDVTMILENFLLLTELWIYRTVYLTLWVEVDAVDKFKLQLDKFWMYQDIKYDFTAKLTGTGDRSEYDIEHYY